MTRRATISIYDGDDFERLADLRREVTIAERRLAAVEREDTTEAARAGDAEPDRAQQARAAVEAARDAFDAFVDDAAQRAEEWVLEPIGHAEFRQLLKDHPPRKNVADDGTETIEPDDELYGVNVETFPKAILTFVDPDDDQIRTVAAPAFDTEAALRRRIKRLAAGELETMWMAAYELNARGITDPKATKFSPTTPRSNET